MGKWDDTEKYNLIVMIGVPEKNAAQQPALVLLIKK